MAGCQTPLYYSSNGGSADARLTSATDCPRAVTEVAQCPLKWPDKNKLSLPVKKFVAIFVNKSSIGDTFS